jgi:hypothetical protein
MINTIVFPDPVLPEARITLTTKLFEDTIKKILDMAIQQDFFLLIP